MTHLIFNEWNDALMSDDLDRVKTIYPQLSRQDINGRTRLHDAAHFGASRCLPWILEQDPSCVHQPDIMGEIPLHRAAGSGRVSVVRQLLAAGSSVHALTRWGCSPLHYGTARKTPDSTAIVHALMAAGSNPEQASDKQETPRQWANTWGIEWPSAETAP